MPRGQRIQRPRQRGGPAQKPRLIARRRPGPGNSTEGGAGDFQRIIDWRLENITGPGLIVQHVVKTWDIEVIATRRKLLTGAAVDGYVLLSGGTTQLGGGWDEYTEAWVVEPGQTTPQLGEGDNFSLTAIIQQPGQSQDTTRGWFQIDGTARFHPTDPNLGTPDPTHYGFNAGDVTNAANGLAYVRGGPPAGLPPPVTGTTPHVVKVEWDTSQWSARDRMWGPTNLVRRVP